MAAIHPGSLEQAIPDVRPGVRIRVGERFPVAWEVYGLGVREPVTVTIGFSRGGRGSWSAWARSSG
jgi:hypothetical protein